MFNVKWFDKIVAQSSKGQFVVFAVAFVGMILAGALVGHFVLDRKNADNAKFGRPATWGLMQCVDGGFVDATITTNTKTTSDGAQIAQEAPLHVIFLSLGFWLFGAILMSFFTGAAANFLDVRREKIRTGDVDYSFDRDYVLVVGYDFQVKNLIRGLLREHPGKSIVLVTDSPVDAINDEIFSELNVGEERRFYAMRKDLTQKESYERLLVLGADEVYVIGDGDVAGRDGRTLKAVDLLAEKARVEKFESEHASTKGNRAVANRKPAKLFLHIEDSALYAQVRAMPLHIDESGLFEVEIYNYYESWAWECWARKDAADGASPCLPLRHSPAAKRVELFVLGAGRMGRAMVDFALPLMNYGANGRQSRITIFDANGLKKGFLPDRETLDALPEVNVRFCEMDGCSDEANEIMCASAEDPDAAVTVVIALKNPDAAVRAYAELSNRLRRQRVSVLVWQSARSANCPDQRYLKMGGSDATADKTEVRYFGMTDRLPWRQSARSEYGMAVNYYYECWFPWGQPPPKSPKAMDDDFAAISRAMWNAGAASSFNGVVAGEEWAKTKRWKKWSSINSGDTFREKATLFDGVSYAEAAMRVLKAEHNRWWTERLLAGWKLDASLRISDGTHADKKNMLHGDMIPFEDLSDSVKDKDKINIAAMIACGFLPDVR